MAELRYKRVSESGKSRYVRNVRRRAPRAVPAKDTWERATSRLAAGFVIKKRLFAAAHAAAPVPLQTSVRKDGFSAENERY